MGGGRGRAAAGPLATAAARARAVGARGGVPGEDRGGRAGAGSRASAGGGAGPAGAWHGAAGAGHGTGGRAGGGAGRLVGGPGAGPGGRRRVRAGGAVRGRAAGRGGLGRGGERGRGPRGPVGRAAPARRGGGTRAVAGVGRGGSGGGAAGPEPVGRGGEVTGVPGEARWRGGRGGARGGGGRGPGGPRAPAGAGAQGGGAGATGGGRARATRTRAGGRARGGAGGGGRGGRGRGGGGGWPRRARRGAGGRPPRGGGGGGRGGRGRDAPRGGPGRRRPAPRVGGSDDLGHLEQGIRGVHALNLSFAGPDNDLLEKIVTVISKGGIPLIAAAGNAGAGSPPLFPAGYPAAIAVTAIDRNKNVYRRAVRGAHIDFAAPGVNVWAAASVSGGKPKSGTSFATPFVTAAAALIKFDRPQASTEDIVTALSASSLDLGEPDKDNIFGHGLIQAERTLRRRASYSPPSRRLIVQSWDFSLSAESDPADANLGMACANEPQLAGRALGKVDNPAFDERTAVVDAHDN